MLTDAQCKGAKGGAKPYKLTDSRGLYLHVSPTGHRSWRHKYRYDGKEKLRTLGSYPDVGLREARELRDEDKRLLRGGKDPIVEAKRASLASRLAAAHTFEAVAREWFSKQELRWKPVHAKDVIVSLERDVFEDIGSLPITAIDATHVLATLQKVEDRGAIETAHRLRQRISAIYAYAIANGHATSDPAASLVKVLKAKPSKRRWPAVITIKEAQDVLSLTDTAEASPVVKLAARFLALTAQRPGMIRWLEWKDIREFNPEAGGGNTEAIWIAPAVKMKQELEQREDESFNHPVPLGVAASDVLREAWKFSAGSNYVFPGAHSIHKPMSENALSSLFLREGLRKRHVPHGWRSTFSTIMNEWIVEHGGPRDPLIIDLMLAHTPTGLSGSELRYMRASFIDRRRKLAAIWADILLADALAVGQIGEGRRRRKA